ncbi:MAG: type II toxin-antitoxin system VapC family toxin [Ilumatobacteraceae bacterium]
MVVADASAIVIAVAATVHGALVRHALASGVTAPHLVDAEVGAALRRLVLRRELDAVEAQRSLARSRRLVRRRAGHGPLMARAWELRDNVSFYDALYVALAEARGLTLLTADGRLASATGPRCRIEVV